MTAEELIAEWWGRPGGQERSNFAAFVPHLCAVLGVPTPGPMEKGAIGAYGYEASVPGGSFRSLKGSGSIDLYRRGHFIMEAKQSYLKPEQESLDLGPDAAAPRAPSGARYDALMREARSQAENYARNLPAGEPVAPFLIVCDVGRAFELYVDTAGDGRGYRFFPDRRSYRIELPQLASDAEVGGTGKSALDLIRAIWTAPRSVDPRHLSADVTRAVSKTLAEVMEHLEADQRLRGQAVADSTLRSAGVEETSLFLMRVLFCMFAEDIGLLPEKSFQNFLASCLLKPDDDPFNTSVDENRFRKGLEDIWRLMDRSGEDRFNLLLNGEVRYFNGSLFRERTTYRIIANDLEKLIDAAKANWRKVEPAIFGTLLEQALDAKERAKLGAHYTPRPYVELLVRATVMDVLEPEWERVEEEIEAALNPSPLQGRGRSAAGAEGEGQVAPLPLSPTLSPEGEREKGLRLAIAFHQRLAQTRVLDPACGTGNFLYVAMELMQELEARVIERIATLGGQAAPLVGPHQFHGLELNPRAAKIAELVLWIGWLRNRLQSDPGNVPEPVLAESASINFGRPGGYDAVLRRGEWGEVDAETAAQPAWPEAEFIVGNPPFIAGQDLRQQLGGDYAEALWKANGRVPPSADFVMQWWDRAAHTLLADGSALRRFGFVTTNSITQEFSRRVIAGYLAQAKEPSPLAGEGGGAAAPEGEGSAAIAAAGAANPSPNPLPQGERALSLVLAIPDHPWTRATKDAAAVRIAMTVAGRGLAEGTLREVTAEARLDSDTPDVTLSSVAGRINADLTVGADVTSTKPLLANQGISHDGVKLHGKGFAVNRTEAELLGLGSCAGLEEYIRPYRNGRDLGFVDKA